MKISLFFLYGIFAIAACSHSLKATGQQVDHNTTSYKESSADFPNPERGFYRYTQTHASKYTPLSLTQLKDWRGLSPAENKGNYSVYSTLVFRYYVLDTFKNKPLSDQYLNLVKADFEIARKAGIKLIPRFNYTNKSTAGTCPEGFICPPYGDAPKEIILNHIAQLKEIFHENADVIACLQMGFIGVWGEQYYTDYFGDASGNGKQGKLLDQNWKDRIEVLKALLDAVPKEIMIQVRYPQIKQRAIYGINALTNVAALTLDEAFSESDKARIGFHNDCLLASPDDYGTYEDYGNSSSERQMDIAVLKKYNQDDAAFVVVGGETCTDNYSPENDCEPAGLAQAELASLHYSFLNCAYNNELNNDWQSGGCMDNIKKQLGYRFVLKNALFPKSVPAGQLLSFKIELENKGYASCYNQRPVMFVLQSASTGQQYYINADGDPRKWFSGQIINWESSVKLPGDIIPGDYEIFLFFPDKHNTISSRPEYAIRLANEDVWEEKTGFNKLGLQVNIK